MSSVAAIIVTYNNERTITMCVQSLRQAKISDIFVVDNASTDKTGMVVRSLSVPILQNGANKGFGAAVNQGVAELTSRGISPTSLLFINPDAYLTQPLHIAEATLEADSRIGIIGLGLQDSTGKPEIFAYGPEPTLWSLVTGRRHRQQTLAWVSGAAMLVRLHMFEQLNGFDEQFFMYWEDVDLCRRARVAGWKVVREPTVGVQHERGASLSNRRAKASLYDASADKYFKKHYSPSIWLLQAFLRRIYRLLSPFSQ